MLYYKHKIALDNLDPFFLSANVIVTVFYLQNDPIIKNSEGLTGLLIYSNGSHF